GTTFKIYFPRVTEASDCVSGTTAPAKAVTASETILLVEDSRLLAKVTRDFLERDGYKVLLASTPREAMRIAENHNAPIHVLLAKRPAMKVLYMSGYTNGILSEHAFKPEEVAFLEKPFSHEALSRKVRQTLNSGAPF